MTKKTKLLPHKLIYVGFLIVAVAIVSFLWYKNWQNKFDAPRTNAPSVEFTVSKDKTLMAVSGDLYYYGFIKNEGAFQYALEHTKDTKFGNETSIKIGNNTIDRETRYTISQSMTTWQLADVLLNQGVSNPCNNGCSESSFNPELLPGGDLAPTIKEKYSWVKTYEDCVKAIGHDGGQLSSEQYAQRTGVRKCVSPDGREFTQGEDGWTDAIGG